MGRAGCPVVEGPQHASCYTFGHSRRSGRAPTAVTDASRDLVGAQPFQHGIRHRGGAADDGGGGTGKGRDKAKGHKPRGGGTKGRGKKGRKK